VFIDDILVYDNDQNFWLFYYGL